ncbi:MAG: Hpt domain-containing protein, partial [Deferribacterales bacterium]
MGKIDKKSLIEFFRVESEEHFEIIMNALHTLMGDIENWSLLDEIFRSAHTIKGSAAMVGFDRLSKVAHSLENIFELFRSGVKKLNVKVIGRIISIIEDLTTLSKSVEDDIAESDRDSLINRINTIENECEDFKKDLSATKEVVKVESKPKTREEILKKADEVFEKVFTTQKTEQFTHVKLSQLDYIVSMLGELISNKNKENFRIKNMFDRFQELSYATGRLNKVVKEIEERFTYSDILGVDDEINKNSRLTDDFSLGEFDRYDIFNIYTRQLSEIANDINMSYKG